MHGSLPSIQWGWSQEEEVPFVITDNFESYWCGEHKYEGMYTPTLLQMKMIDRGMSDSQLISSDGKAIRDFVISPP